VKEAIIDGYVAVNGEVDRRRGRQLQLGDIVSFEGRRVRVVRESTEADGDMDHQAQKR
jgi:ribosome-associated protein YbcJ (S4-like RNA binding protein)